MSTLVDYLQNLEGLSAAQVQVVRQRLVSVLSSSWPDLDTSPNSVAGDLIVTPDAVLIATAEAAMSMLMSDMDLSNVAAGVVYNPTFVQAYLNNIGVTALANVAATGVIALTFSENQNYVIDSNSKFLFGSSVFQINAGAGNPVVVYAVNASNPGISANPWILTKTDAGKYVVYLPVTGPAGASVSDGASAGYTLTIPQLQGVVAAGDFDAGAAAESLAQMAARAQQTFAAANLNTRSGAVSFLKQRWPQLISSYVALTGDPEMKRSGTNPLGISDGAMDIRVKSMVQFASGNSVVPLTYDATAGGWVGRLNLPVTPAFYSLTAGVFQTSNFMNSRSLNTVYAQSEHPAVDDASVSLSKYEKLGIFIVDTNPQGFTQSSVSNVVESAGTGAQLAVSGEYASDYFNASSARAITMRLSTQTTWEGVPALSAIVRDNLSGDSGTVYFVATSSVNPTGGKIVKGTVDYNRLLRGLDLQIATASGGFNAGDFIGSNFSFGFSGRSASFNVNYVYDPALIQIDSTLQDPDNRPVGVDVIVRSFMPCHISQFTVNYRIGFGQTFDADTAASKIYAYLNSIGTPDVYEESRIGQIVMTAGASGLISVSKAGVFHPSLANKYVDQHGVISNIPKFATSTLVPPANNVGLSSNSVTYIISQNTIAFNATVY